MSDLKKHAIENVLEAIGWTPLVRLHRVATDIPAFIYAKVEYLNPGGSVKDRVAVAMVDDAERSGQLRPGGTIVEATAGNTGVGLALVAAVRGYRCIFVMPDKMSADKVRLLKAYGAEVVITPTNVPPDSPASYNGVAERLSREIAGAWRPNQFSNLVNPRAHYEQTGPEIWEQTEGRVTAFVAGAGTGGTISGVGQFLKEKNPRVRVIGADIEGSVLSGDTPKAWKVEGIGEDFVPRTLNGQVIDEWIRISDAESFNTARRVAREEGLMLGGSSGTALAAAFKYARRCTADDVIVVLCPDTGRNYLGKMYDDEWMATNGFLETPPEHATIGDVLRVLDREGRLVALQMDQTLADALTAFERHSISQAPVLDMEGHVMGAVEEVTVLRALRQDMSPKNTPLERVMARPLPQLDEAAHIEEAYRLLLSGSQAIVVMRDGIPVGIVTRFDLLAFFGKTRQ
jgi:cystathionine beta-synthase